jgi:Zn-dependent peptidase ImmA (M78 family)
VPDGGGYEAWEGVARAVHDATGIDAPVSAFDLATAYGLACVPGARGTASLEGDVVRYDAQARLVRQHGSIAHEVAHYVLRLHGEPDPELAVRYTAGALMLPRSTFDRDVAREAWDLQRLCELHPNASAEMVARRISQVREAVVTVLDQGAIKARVSSPWMREPPRRLTPMERELVDAALECGEAQRASELLSAYPFVDGMHRRVIVVAEVRQLSLRL